VVVVAGKDAEALPAGGWGWPKVGRPWAELAWQLGLAARISKEIIPGWQVEPGWNRQGAVEILFEINFKNLGFKIQRFKYFETKFELKPN
jgi:hypothetical protein